ncbi:MAG: hypothetical protein DCC59_06145 [Chloroflexi bacterium]|nr:MAG: hypothetical protein DCC59_06145 [Chloroflexota bacterium]
MMISSQQVSCPRLGFIGPVSGGGKQTIPTPGEFLAERFHEEGCSVVAESAYRGKAARLLDVCNILIRHNRNIDILVLSVYLGQGFFLEDLASLVAGWLRIPVVMVLHNGLTPAFVSLFPEWTSRFFRRARVLVAPSAFLPRSLRPFGMTVRVIPNPIDIGLYPFRLRKQASPRLLWMRSFYPYYNPQMAVRALTHLKEKHDDLSLVMAGKDKGLQLVVSQLAAELGVEAQVAFCGFLQGNEKLDRFDQADIFINTNNVDNAPVSIVEAWAMGTPVVSTNVGGIADLVQDGETGLLVPDDDDRAMAESIERLLKSPDLVRKLSAQGYEQAKKCSWQAVLPQWKNLFEEIGGRR